MQVRPDGIKSANLKGPVLAGCFPSGTLQLRRVKNIFTKVKQQDRTVKICGGVHAFELTMKRSEACRSE